MKPLHGPASIGHRRRLSEPGLPRPDFLQNVNEDRLYEEINLPPSWGKHSVFNFIHTDEAKQAVQCSRKAGDIVFHKLQLHGSRPTPVVFLSEQHEKRHPLAREVSWRVPTFQRLRRSTVLQHLPGQNLGICPRQIRAELNWSGRFKRWDTAVAIRSAFRAITSHPVFESSTLALICANCVTLAMHNPLLPEDAGINAQLSSIDLIFNFIFTAEMLMRILALGGILPYLSSSWNAFDFAMVLAGYTQFIPTGSTASAGGFRALRAVRALRPLRTITRFSSLRAVVVCFLEAVPLLMSLMVFLLFMFFLFAIAGMVLFQEAYHRACANDMTGLLEAVGQDSTGEFSCGYRGCPENYTCTYREQIEVPTPGFDNIALAMLTVFQCTTISGWSYVMYRVQDAIHPVAAFYFLALVLLCAYFVINLFLAVLKLKFGKAQGMLDADQENVSRNQALRAKLVNMLRARSGALAARLKSLRHQLTLSSILSSARNDTGHGSTRRMASSITLSSNGNDSRQHDGTSRLSALWQPSMSRMAERATDLTSQACEVLARVNSSRIFRHAILVLIIISTVALAVEYDDMPAAQVQILNWVNLGVTCAFSVEVVIGVISDGPTVYWRDRSKLLDLMVVIVSGAELGITATADGEQSDLTTVRVLKSLRVLRVLKVFKYIESLVKIGEVLEASMASFVAIGVLALLFMIVFAIVGLHVFGGALSTDIFPNFNTFFNSFLTMFQILTMEDWEITMTRLVAATNWGAALYLLAWILIGHFVVLTLFLAVILEAFESMYDVGTGKELVIAEIEARKRVAAPTRDSDQKVSVASTDNSSQHSAFVTEFSKHQKAVAFAPSNRVGDRHPQTVSSVSELTQQGLHADPHSRSLDSKDAGRGHDLDLCIEGYVTNRSMRRTLLSSITGPDAVRVDRPADSVVHHIHEPDKPHPIAEGIEAPPTTAGGRAALRNAVIDTILSAPYPTSYSSYNQGTKPGWRSAAPNRAVSILSPAKGTQPHQATVMSDAQVSFEQSMVSTRRGHGCGGWSNAQTKELYLSLTRGPRPQKPLTPSVDPLSLEHSFASTAQSCGRSGWSNIQTKELYMSIVWNQPGMAAVLAGRSVRQSMHRSAAGPALFGAGGQSRQSEGDRRGSEQQSAAGGEEVVKGRRSAIGLWAKVNRAGQVIRRVQGPTQFKGGAMAGPAHGAQRAIVPKFVPTSVSIAPVRTRREVRLSERIPDFSEAAALALPTAAGDMHDLLMSSRRPAVPRQPAEVIPPAHAPAGTTKAYAQLTQEVHAYKRLVEQADFGRNALDVVVHVPQHPWPSHEGHADAGPHARPFVDSHDDVPKLTGKAFNVFPADMWLRRKVFVLVTNGWFDHFMLFCIFLSCCAMVYEHPGLKPGALDTRILQWLDIVLTALFGAECLLKMFAFSVRQYLIQNSNKLDCFIVCTSVLLIAAETSADGFQAIKAFRVLRALKPLRTLTHSAGMLLVLKSVTLSVAAMANVSLLVFLFFVIFGVMGMQLFSGLLYRCSDGSLVSRDACTGTFIDENGDAQERSWDNYPVNFDNIGNAFLALFVTVSLDGYSGLLVRAVSAPSSKDQEPKFMHSPLAAFYFITFITVCSFCLLNLYVGVVFFQFSRIRLLAQTGAVFMSERQQQWVEMAKMTFRTRPREIPPQQSLPVRRWARSVSISKRFEIAVLAVVVANVIIMALNTYGQSRSRTTVFERINLVFSLVFIVEAVIKILGFGWRFYIRSGWNKFDFVLVVASVIDFAMAAVGSSVGGGIFNILRSQKILRVTRITRMLKLIKSFKSLQSLFVTLWISLPAFWNVGALLLLIMFVYSYLGVQLLGTVRHRESINEHANFERFWMAMLTLFRVATNDEWLGIMIDAMDRSDCGEGGATNCGTWVAAPYFVSYIITVSIIMLNLFTAVIIENFEKQQQSENWEVQPAVLDDLAETWAEFDDGSGSIPSEVFEEFLKRLGPPLGLPANATNGDVFKLAARVNIPLVNGRLPFARTTYELVRSYMQEDLPPGEIREQLHALVNRNFGGTESLEESMTASGSLTVLRLQLRWRLRMRIAAVQRRRAFGAAHSATACPTYSALFSQRHHFARQIADLAAAPPTRMQLRTSTAGNALDGVRYTFGIEVAGVAPHVPHAADAPHMQPWHRSQLAAWRQRVLAYQRPGSQHASGTNQGRAADQLRGGLASGSLSRSIKRFALASTSPSRRQDSSPEGAQS
eukprot:jgi/Ulvmu1/1279/UM011_0003.1